jgi:tellurite resistance protein
MEAKAADAAVTLCLMAAFADGRRSDVEESRLRQAVESLGRDSITAMLPKVILGQVTIEQIARDLPDPAQRRLAYELAVCVCDADGATNDKERRFLGEAARVLGLGGGAIDAVQQADAFASAAATPHTGPLSPALGPAPMDASRDAEIDAAVLSAAKLCAAIELLPQGLASAAIIPLQMRLVYTVGRKLGHSLDRGHIAELLAAAGLGVTSQAVESVARRVLGGLLGSIGRAAGVGGLAHSVANWGTGPLMTFASTYALGQVAKSYYAGGRTLSAVDLRALFARETQRAQALFPQVQQQIQTQAGSLDASTLLASVRGG